MKRFALTLGFGLMVGALALLSQQRPQGSIAGTVRYIDGTPMFGLYARLTDQGRQTLEVGVQGGRFEFSGLRPGNYEVHLIMPGLPEERQQVTLSPSEKRVLNFTMRPPESPLYEPRPHWTRLPFPGQSLIGMWGWLGPTTYQRERRDGVGEGLDYFRHYIVDEPFRWGANLLEFYPPEMRKGFPIPWSARDLMARPDSYWGGFLNPQWPTAAQRELVKYVHSKDWIIHVFYHPDFIRKRQRADDPPGSKYASGEDFPGLAVQAAERIWRDYSNPLLFGWESSLDGFGYEGWFRDLESRTNNALWKYNPGTYLHSTQTLPEYTPNFSGSLMCARGRPGWGNAAGLSDRWRNFFLPPAFLSYQADCRMEKPSEKVWDYWGAFGGGSYPDWLLKQVNDFSRVRLADGSAIWWLGEPEYTLPKPYRPYVYAASMDPIKAAFTWKLTSTGKGGYRDAVKAAQTDVPVGFGSEYEERHDTAFIQNNYLRLYRLASEDGGALLYNRDHLAHYDKHSLEKVDTVEVSGALWRTLPHSVVAPNVEPWQAQIGKPDGSSQEFRPKGKYWDYIVFETERQRASEFPARIGYEDEPEWPSVIELNIEAPIGSYELEVRQLAETAEPTTVGVYLDGEIVGTYGVRNDGTDAIHHVPYSITDPGGHIISLKTLKGGGHRFDSLLMRRLKPEAVRFSFLEPGGHVAVMREDILVPGDLHETRFWRIQNDSPWLELEVKRQSSRSGPVTSAIDTEGFDRLLSKGELLSASRHMGPPPRLLMLRDSSGSKPDLVLALEKRGSISSWTWHAGRRLEFHGQGGEEEIRVMFLVPEGIYDSDREIESVVKEMAKQPQKVALGDSGTAVISNTTLVPRVALVEILDPDGSPYFVSETGTEGPHWSFRGGQPRASNGGRSDFLKVYLAPKGQATIQRFGYLRGVVRPGWGCQNLIQISYADLQPNAVTVNVTKLSPLIFAPRIRFSQPVRSVRLNGKPWRYSEGHHVYLPAAIGRYRVEVEYGDEDAPRLTRTFALVKGAVWDATAKTLTVSSRAPAGYESGLPGAGMYTMLVHHDGYRLLRAQGAEPIPSSEYRIDLSDLEAMSSAGTILRFQPGEAVLHFSKR